MIPSFDTIDVMLSPTIAIPPPTLEAVGDKENYISQNFQCLRNTCVANMLDLAALTMPTGLDSRGLPVGLQILAPAGNEELLLAVALELEQFLGTPGDRLGRPPMLAGTNV